jgi:hypothetical protein
MTGAGIPSGRFSAQAAVLLIAIEWKCVTQS